MREVKNSLQLMQDLSQQGVHLALDDFGTGYSSLSYLQHAPFDTIKIDKSFIDGVDSSPEDRAIVEHVVGMAQALGMVTVAEGVERVRKRLRRFLPRLKRNACTFRAEDCGDLAQARQEAGRRDEVAALAHDRFDDDGRNGAGIMQRDQTLKILGQFQTMLG